MSGIVIFERKRPVFTQKQFERLSNICDNVGQGVFVVSVVTQIFIGLDRINWSVVVFGVSISLVCWSIALLVARNGSSYDI